MAKKISYAKLSNIYTTKQINEMREELIKKHGNKCAICDKPRSHFKRNFAIDHDHKTGKVRGLLCYADNKFFVGRFDIPKACRLLKYLLIYGDPESNVSLLDDVRKLIEDKIK